MQQLLELPMVGPYTINTWGGPYYNYTTDVLSDHDAGTGIQVNRFIGPSGVFKPNIQATLGKPPAGTVLDTSQPVDVYCRFTGQQAGVAGIRLRTGAGNSSSMDPTKPPIETELGTLFPMDSNALNQVRNAMGNTYTVFFYVDFFGDRDNNPAPCWIGEAWIVVFTKTTVAPPCRLFPREDDLGVGSARKYPPPKSQQRSGRRFGYY